MEVAAVQAASPGQDWGISQSTQTMKAAFCQEESAKPLLGETSIATVFLMISALSLTVHKNLVHCKRKKTCFMIAEDWLMAIEFFSLPRKIKCMIRTSNFFPKLVIEGTKGTF